MTAAIQLVYFLRMFATGAFAPVLALMLMAHGATIETLSLLIGAYSVTVVATEFPSGVLADLFGQKRAFLASTLCGALSFGFILVSRSVPVLLLAMVLNGLSRAFSSGTLDALAVNQSAARDDSALLAITARFSVLESAGLALGALAGGALASIGSLYAANIAVSIVINLLLFVLTLLFIHETRPPAAGERSSLRALFGGRMKQSVSFILQKGVVRTLLLFSVITGFALITVETYWQPAFTAFQPPTWTLGVVTFFVFASVMLGSKLTERLLKHHTRHVPAAFLLLRAVFGAGLIALYFTGSAVPFVAVYMASYFFLGGGSVAENTLIHRFAADEQRSSILSLFSFILQIGGVLAAVAGYFVSAGLSYQLMWPIAGFLLLVFALLRLPAHRQRKNRSAA